MATIDSVMTKIRNLISRSNTATGRTDVDLTAAVGALIDGYGKGGITGLNARIFTATLSSDATGTANFLTNEWLKSIRSNPNAFVLLRYMGMAPSTAAVNAVLTANFPLTYSGTTMYNSVVLRSTASSQSTNLNTLGLTGSQYNGHLNINADGKLFAYGNATYPIKAGQYQIIAGLVEML